MTCFSLCIQSPFHPCIFYLWWSETFPAWGQFLVTFYFVYESGNITWPSSRGLFPSNTRCFDTERSNKSKDSTNDDDIFLMFLLIHWITVSDSNRWRDYITRKLFESKLHCKNTAMFMQIIRDVFTCTGTPGLALIFFFCWVFLAAVIKVVLIPEFWRLIRV